MLIKSICKKCIHDFGDGCEAFRDEYMQILEKMNVKILMMVHVTCFLLNLPVVKMNIQKNGADILTIIIVNVDDTI